MLYFVWNRYLRYGVATNALLSDTNPIAGYLLSEEFETKLTDAMNSIGVIRSLCTEVNTSGDRIMPIVNGHGQPQWVPEGGTIPMVRDGSTEGTDTNRILLTVCKRTVGCPR